MFQPARRAGHNLHKPHSGPRSRTTTTGETSLLDISYSYNQASDRIGMRSGGDNWEYLLDGAGRLIEETLNRFVERKPERFLQGELALATLPVCPPGVGRIARASSGANRTNPIVFKRTTNGSGR